MRDNWGNGNPVIVMDCVRMILGACCGSARSSWSPRFRQASSDSARVDVISTTVTYFPLSNRQKCLRRLIISPIYNRCLSTRTQDAPSPLGGVPRAGGDAVPPEQGYTSPLREAIVALRRLGILTPEVRKGLEMLAVAPRRPRLSPRPIQQPARRARRPGILRAAGAAPATPARCRGWADGCDQG